MVAVVAVMMMVVMVVVVVVVVVLVGGGGGGSSRCAACACRVTHSWAISRCLSIDKFVGYFALAGAGLN